EVQAQLERIEIQVVGNVGIQEKPLSLQDAGLVQMDLVMVWRPAVWVIACLVSQVLGIHEDLAGSTRIESRSWGKVGPVEPPQGQEQLHVAVLRPEEEPGSGEVRTAEGKNH